MTKSGACEKQPSKPDLDSIVHEYRAIMDAVQDPLFIHDSEFRITRANRAYIERAGKDFHEVIGQHYWEVYPPLDGPCPACRAMAEARASGFREEALHLPTGEVLYTRIFPVISGGPRGSTCLHVLLDLSTAKTLQHQLDESRERLDLALASASAGTWEWDIVNDRVVWDFHLNRLRTGEGRALKGPLVQALSFIHVDDRAEVHRRLLNAANNHEEHCRVEFRLCAPGEPTRFVVLQAKLHRDAADQAERMVGLCWDVTERRKTEEKNRWLAEIVSSANAAIAGLSPEGLILSWNAAAARMYGYSAGEVLGKHFTTLVPPEGRDEVIDLFERAKRGERITGFETKRFSRDGTPFWILLTLSPIFDQQSTLRGVSASILDVTKQKQAEADRNEGLTRLQKALLGTIEAISTTLELRDPYTAGHEQRVSDLAVAIGRQLKWSEERLEGLRLGALVHDIGKIAVPSEILTRPGKLTAAEYEIIKEHPKTGADILSKVDLPWPLVDMVRHHHERLDGSGYPDGLKGDEISPEARVLAVADVVEAMSSHRPYRPGLGVDFALREIRENSGKLYDPKVVNACLCAIAEGDVELKDGHSYVSPGWAPPG